jgi:DNA-binding NarL/FixJ family response regulator
VLSSVLAVTSEVAVPKNILIVDDHAYIRKTIRDCLESQTGFNVCGEAVDGLDAIQKAASLNPDLIILDLKMPRMNGLDAARILKQILPSAPIILFALNADTVRPSEVTDLGIRAVLSKTDDLGLLTSHSPLAGVDRLSHEPPYPDQLTS